MSDPIKRLETPNEKIERLEAELADLRRSPSTQIVLDQYERRMEELEAELAACEQVREATASEYRRLYAELADLRASSVVVRRKCETCFKGLMCIGADPHDHDDGCRCPEPDCDGGWQLAEGVRKRPESEWAVNGHWYVIPARLIEGDTDE